MKMSSRIGRCLLTLTGLLLIAVAATAHRGKSDAYGCHNDRKTGGYHCDAGPLTGRFFSSKAEMLQVLKGNNAEAKAALL